jgi:hypothetical protein
MASMWGGFDLSSIVEAGTKLKEEVESNISSWDQTGQRADGGSLPKPDQTGTARADDDAAPGAVLGQLCHKRNPARVDEIVADIYQSGAERC